MFMKSLKLKCFISHIRWNCLTISKHMKALLYAIHYILNWGHLESCSFVATKFLMGFYGVL